MEERIKDRDWTPVELVFNTWDLLTGILGALDYPTKLRRVNKNFRDAVDANMIFSKAPRCISDYTDTFYHLCHGISGDDILYCYDFEKSWTALEWRSRKEKLVDPGSKANYFFDYLCSLIRDGNRKASKILSGSIVTDPSDSTKLVFDFNKPEKNGLVNWLILAALFLNRRDFLKTLCDEGMINQNYCDILDGFEECNGYFYLAPHLLTLQYEQPGRRYIIDKRTGEKEDDINEDRDIRFFIEGLRVLCEMVTICKEEERISLPTKKEVSEMLIRAISSHRYFLSRYDMEGEEYISYSKPPIIMFVIDRCDSKEKDDIDGIQWDWKNEKENIFWNMFNSYWHRDNDKLQEVVVNMMRCFTKKFLKFHTTYKRDRSRRLNKLPVEIWRRFKNFFGVLQKNFEEFFSGSYSIKMASEQFKPAKFDRFRKFLTENEQLIKSKGFFAHNMATAALKSSFCEDNEKVMILGSKRAPFLFYKLLVSKIAEDSASMNDINSCWWTSFRAMNKEGIYLPWLGKFFNNIIDKEPSHENLKVFTQCFEKGLVSKDCNFDDPCNCLHCLFSSSDMLERLHQCPKIPSWVEDVWIIFGNSGRMANFHEYTRLFDENHLPTAAGRKDAFMSICQRGELKDLQIFMSSCVFRIIKDNVPVDMGACLIHKNHQHVNLPIFAAIYYRNWDIVLEMLNHAYLDDTKSMNYIFYSAAKKSDPRHRAHDFRILKPEAGRSTVVKNLLDMDFYRGLKLTEIKEIMTQKDNSKIIDIIFKDDGFLQYLSYQGFTDLRMLRESTDLIRDQRTKKRVAHEMDILVKLRKKGKTTHYDNDGSFGGDDYCYGFFDGDDEDEDIDSDDDDETAYLEDDD